MSRQEEPRRPLPPGAQAQAEEVFKPYARPPLRRRLWIAALAAVTALGVVWLLLDPPGGVQRRRAPPADVARCAGGQTEGCVGSKTQVLPAATGASAPGR